MEKHMPSWSQRLRRERERRGWSQYQVAGKINVDPKTIGRWESGKTKTLPRLDHRALLCSLYEKTDVELGFVSEDNDSAGESVFLDQHDGVKNQDSSTAAPAHKEVRHIDWGEAPSVERLLGRNRECIQLEQWIVDDNCRVVAVLGTGGIGKTALTVTATEQLQSKFDHIAWYSLQNAPPLENILKRCIPFFSGDQYIDLPQDLEDQLSLLINQLRNRRCLLILDNLETVMQGGDETGHWRESYEGYGRLIKRVGESQHLSCLLLTSREKPKEVAHEEGTMSLIRSLHLTGLELAEGKGILQDKGLFGSDEAWKALIYLYSGNPLALKIVSGTIREVFGGAITRFLKEGMAVFGDVHDLLERQFHRLSASEQEVLYWLAIEREAVSLDDLREDIVRPVSREALLRTLDSLRRRYMIETSNTAHFILQPVIMEYVTNDLVKQICREIETEKPKLLANHALMKAQAKNYVRESQVRLILMPVAQQLLDALGREYMGKKARRMLSSLRKKPPGRSNYAAGNVLNLLIQLRCDLRGYDFSQLPVWHAYLQDVALPEVNFAHADLTKSVFTDTFGAILTVALSPNGGLLAVGTGNGEVRLLHTTSSTSLLTCLGHTHWVWSVVFSPDGALLASGSEDQTVRLWEVSTGQCLKTFQDHTSYTNQIRSVAFSPDGGLLASGGDDPTVRLWEVSTGQQLRALHGHSARIRSVAFSPDGNLLASGGDDETVRLWEVSTGRCLRTLHGHSSWVYSVAFSPDSTLLASSGEDQVVRLWEVSSGQQLRALHGHTNWIWSVAFSPDGTLLASGSEDQTARLWEVSSGRCLKTLHGHANRIRSVSFGSNNNLSRDDLLASGSDDQTVCLWEVSTGQQLRALHGHSSWVRSVAFSPDGTLLASGGDDQAARLWEVSSGQQLRTLHDRSSWVWSVAFSPDGTLLVTGSEDQTVRLWEVSSGRCLRTLHGHSSWVRSVAFSPDGTLLASCGDDETVRLWEVSSGLQLRTLHGHSSWVYSVAFSPDGTLLASASDEDQAVCIWEVNSGQQLRTLHGHSGRVRSVAFSPDGTLLVTGSEDQTARLWEVSSGRCLRTLHGHSSWVRSVAFSPDGTLLVTGSEDQTVRLWEVNSGQQLKTLHGHSSRVYSVAFSPDGTLLASASDDGAIKLWEEQTGLNLKTLQSEKLYERMNITGVLGITDAQKAILKALGAIEN